MTLPSQSIIHKLLDSIQLYKHAPAAQERSSFIKLSAARHVNNPPSQRKRRRSMTISLVIPPSLLNLKALPGSPSIYPLESQPLPEGFTPKATSPAQQEVEQSPSPAIECLSPLPYDHPSAIPPCPQPDDATLTASSDNMNTPITTTSPSLDSFDNPPQYTFKPRPSVNRKPRPQGKGRKPLPLYKQVLLNRFRMTAHGLEIIHRGPKRGIRYLLEQESKALRQAIKLRSIEREERRRSLVTRTTTTTSTLPANVPEVTPATGRTLRRIGRAQSWSHLPTQALQQCEPVIDTAYKIEFWGWDR